MRSKTLQEGGLGLFILAGIAAVGGILLWLSKMQLGVQKYHVWVQFDDANGMKVGAPVRYRGVDVGKIQLLKANANGILVQLQIQRSDLLIPQDVQVQANQAGLIGETAIDLIPSRPLAEVALNLTPFKNCNPQLILCDQGDRPQQATFLKGQVGASFPELLRSTDDFTKAYSNPEFTKKVQDLTVSANTTAREIATLSRELVLLSRAVRQEMQGLGSSSRQLIATSNDTMKRAGRTADEFARLAQSLDGTVQENRRSLNSTLVSIGQTSDQMRLTLKRVDGTLAKANTDAIFKNLEELTRNAAAASADVKVMTKSLSDPATILTLQKTLDSARATFENTQKITSDIDELTGNPEFRRNLIQLINGLSQLVSSSQQLERQIQIAQTLEPMRQNLQVEQQKWVQQQAIRYNDRRQSQVSTQSPLSFAPTNKTPKAEQFH